jgi:hypothetical protein
MVLTLLFMDHSMTFSVIVPCMWLPWGGFMIDGREKPPPLLHLSVGSGLISAISMFVATFNLFRALDRSRFVVRRRIRALSWEMVDWVLYEVSVTSTMAMFLFFWLVQLPTADTRIHLLRIEGVLVHFLLVSIDFYLTTPHYRKNHVLLTLLWPCFWLMLQFVWIVAGHQPTTTTIDFHRWPAPLVAVCLLGLYAVVFLVLHHIAGRLRAAQSPTTMTQEDLSKSKLVLTQTDGELHVTPNERSSLPLPSSVANFELMALSQRANGMPVSDARDSTDSESGVYRIGGSDASSSDNSQRVIAMGSWAGELPPHVQADEDPRENSALMSLHHLR